MPDPEQNIDSDAFVDISAANRRVWLVKVPDFFAEKLEEVENEYEGQDMYIGSVKAIPSKNGGPPQLQIQLDEDGPMSQDIPLQYTLSSVKPSQKIYLMVNSAETDEVLAIQGKVEQECHMMPVLDDERYRSVLKNRNLQANRPKRTVQLVQDYDSQFGIQHVSERSLQSLNMSKHIEPDLRRERLPQGEVMNMIFTLFERFERLTFNEIVSHTNQPPAFIKELLSEVAIYNKRGPYKNYYELLPQYTKRPKNSAS